MSRSVEHLVLMGVSGCGKTTTLRMLLGLIRPDDGEMRIFDHEVPCGLPEVIDRVGAIVENPTFAPNMSLRRNLEILAISTGVPSRRVTEVLLEVGLRGREKAAFHTCSLGMKQRLAIAATLLREPDLLIFDEPTNGLDPAGIEEVRRLLVELSGEGVTVMVSSHLLDEIDKMANVLGILANGRMIFQGTRDQLFEHSIPDLVIETPDARAALAQGITATPIAEGIRVSGLGKDQTAELVYRLAVAGVPIHGVRRVQQSLEDVFMDLTGRGGLL